MVLETDQLYSETFSQQAAWQEHNCFNRIIKGAPLGVGYERKHRHLRKGAPS